MLEHLRNLRNGWSDEISDVIVHFGTYKARKSWFQGIVIELELGIINGEITDPAIIQAAERFMDRHTSQEFQNQELTTREDIEAGNRIVDLILGR